MSQKVIPRSSAGPRDELRAIENRAVVVRKLLTQLKGRLPRGVMGDAEKLVRIIESLARYGQRCSAADAVGVRSKIDVLLSLLGNEVDGFSES